MMTSPMRRALVAAVVFLLGHAPAAFAQGCAMCGTALGANDPKTNAFFWSILFMMCAPYTLVGVVAFWLYRNRRPRGVVPTLDVLEPKESLT